MNMNEFRNKLKTIVKNNDNFVLTTHEDSDGDGLGAQFALFLYLDFLYKNVKIVNNEKALKKYDFLKMSDLIQKKYDKPFDYIFMIDYNEKSRIGENLEYLLNEESKIIRIDHHRNPPVISKSLSYIDVYASSVCEIIYKLLKEEIKKFDEERKYRFANCIYTGIIFDTDNFRNPNVRSSTFQVAKELLDIGVDFRLCYNSIFNDNSFLELKLLGHTLTTLEEFDDGKIVTFITTREMVKKINAKIDMSKGFTKEVKPNKKREVVIFFRELGFNHYRVSLRSQNIDVQKIAKLYDGGGHELAAGFEIKKKSLPIIKKELISKIKSARKYSNTNKM